MPPGPGALRNDLVLIALAGGLLSGCAVPETDGLFPGPERYDRPDGRADPRARCRRQFPLAGGQGLRRRTASVVDRTAD